MVVASAGNYGQTPEGKQVYGSVTSPGISPYAITVGALRTQGTVDPSDDEVAPWSSKGPTMVDHIVKPDLVAPGFEDRVDGGEGLDAGEAVPGSPDRRPRRARLLLDERHEHGGGGGERRGGVAAGWRAELTPLQVKLALQASADFMPAAGLLAGGAGKSGS